MQNVEVQRSSQESQYRDMISVQVNSQQFTFQRNNQHIADFLWSLHSQLTSLKIQIPDDPLSLDNQQMGQLLSQIACNPKLANSNKVKLFLTPKKQDQTKQIKISAEIVKTCRPIKSTVSIHNPELIPYIQSFGYSEIVPIADGASKAVFKAKTSRNQFVAVKITRLLQNHNEEEDIMKELEQKMARAFFGGFLKVNKLKKDEQNMLMIIEQQLANKTLKDIIIQKRTKQENFTQQQLKIIIKDLVQSLYHMHVQNQVAHRDIKPDNIFYMQHRYSFGDYGEAEKKAVNILSPNIKMKMTKLKGSPMYMQPKLLKLFNEKVEKKDRGSISLTHTFFATQNNFQYDPFKADIYSLGLVFFELCLHNLGYTLDAQIQNIFYYERGEPFFKQCVSSIDLRSKQQKYVFFEKYLYQMPSILQKMLEQDQNLRITTFNLALLATPKQTILSHILTPFTDIFLPNATLDNESQKYIVQYNYKSMIYQGEYVNKKRQGYGILYNRVNNLNKIKELPTEQSQQDSGYKSNLGSSDDKVQLYEGYWKNDLPHGQGKLTLNDSDNRYQGEFTRGMFSGEGGLYYEKTTLFKSPWRANYNQYILKYLSQFPYGLFRFQMVCPISKTIFGYQQPLPLIYEDTLKKIFVIQIQVQESYFIKCIVDEILLCHKKMLISKIQLKRNLMFGFSEYLLENQDQSINIVFKIDVDIESWVLTKIMATMNVEKTSNLILNYSEIGAEAFLTMANKPRCFNLTEINLSNCYFIDPDGLNRFFATSMVNSVTKLNLSNTLINNDTIRIFAESKFLIRLRQFILRGCLGITDYAMYYFIKSPNVKQIQLFDIGNTNLSQGFTKGFLLQNHFKKLRKLKIDYITILQQDILNLKQQPSMQNLVEFHADPLWINHIECFSKLRSVVFKGDTKIPLRQLIQFIKNWKHAPLDISAIKITKQQYKYQSYEQYIPIIQSSSINSLLVGCSQIDVFFIMEMIKSQLQVLEVDMNKSIQSFREQFQNIKARNWSVGQIVFYYNKSVLEYLSSLVELDFSKVKINSIRIVGLYSEAKVNIFEQMQDNKIRFLQFCEMLKKITTVIQVKTVKIQEIFYTDQQIAEMIKFKLNSNIEQLIINGIKFSVINHIEIDNDCINYCNLNQTQTLDQAFHALSASESLTQLQGLNLFKRQNVGQKGLAHIINSKYCQNIKQLDLSYTDVGTNIFSLLKNSQHLFLNKLILNGIKKFTFHSLQQYIRSENAKQIRKISLKDTNLNQLDVFFLQLTLDQLEEIDIKFQTSLELQHINPQQIQIKSKKLIKIYLDLSSCQIKCIIAKIFEILSSPVLTKLKLNLRSCKQKQLKHCDVSELIFLKFLKARSFEQFRIYFDQTSIFENSFIVYLQTINTLNLDLSFARAMNNQFAQKLSFIFPNFRVKNISLNFQESYLDNNSSENIYNLIKGMKKVEELSINFSKCKTIIRWNKIVEAFSTLMEVKKINLNFSDSKIGDQFQKIVVWLNQLSRKHKIEMTLDLAHCERIKSGKVFSLLAQLLTDKKRFLNKIRLDVTRFNNIPLDFKYKLIQLKNSSEVYELLVDSSDR